MGASLGSGAGAKVGTGAGVAAGTGRGAAREVGDAVGRGAGDTLGRGAGAGAGGGVGVVVGSGSGSTGWPGGSVQGRLAGGVSGAASCADAAGTANRATNGRAAASTRVGNVIALPRPIPHVSASNLPAGLRRTVAGIRRAVIPCAARRRVDSPVPAAYIAGLPHDRERMRLRATHCMNRSTEVFQDARSCGPFRDNAAFGVSAACLPGHSRV